MREREKYENGLFTIRFNGQDFDSRGVNIYDLGNALLALQRIVNKAHLAKEGRLKKGAYPSKKERPRLSLQLGERRRKSDAFALVPVLTDPSVQEYMKQLAGYVFEGMVGYYTGKVLERIHREPDQDKKIFIGSLHADMVNIVERIEASGSVESISIGSPALGKETIAAFNPQTKDYLRELSDQYFLGSYQEIKGRPYKLYPDSRIVAIRRAGGNTVSIFLNDVDFDSIRYSKERDPQYIFKGRPRYQFGVETKVVTDFEANEIEMLTDT